MESCTNIRCWQLGQEVLCYCQEINASDGRYVYDGLYSANNQEASTYSTHNSTPIPLGSKVNKVTACVEWFVQTTSSATCYVYLDNGTLVLLDSTCRSTEQLYCYDSTPHVPNASVANNLKIKVSYYYTGSTTRLLLVDYAYIQINYTKYIYSDYFNLTWPNGTVIQDGYNLNRSDVIKATARWRIVETTAIDKAKIEHNGTGLLNYTIPVPYTGNWTNYTLTLSNTAEFPKAGMINISAIYANETYGLENKTTTSHYFYLWGYSSLSNISFDNKIFNGTSTQIACQVLDSNSSSPISGYTVYFYNNTKFLGTNQTNSTGWAIWNYTDFSPSPTSYNLTCNITDAPGLYYNVSQENNKKSLLQIIDLTVFANVSKTSLSYGENVTLIASVTTDGTPVTNSWANITYTDITDGNLQTAWETVTLPCQAITSENYNCTVDYRPKRSGKYNVTIYANASRTRHNTTNFGVSFGSTGIAFLFPNYRVLKNQTFNITVNVTANGGDVWYTNITLSITNQTKMNITASENFSKPSLYNISNGSSIVVKWSAQSLDIGLTSVVVNATPQNGTATQSSSSHNVILPIVETSPSTANITGSTILRAKIVGNVTALDQVNFTVKKPYSSGIDYTGSTFKQTLSEVACTGETTGSGRVTVQPNATCTGTDCSLTIDNNTDTSWTGSSSDELIITLDKEYVIERFSLLWRKVTGTGNATVYYNSSAGWTTIPSLTELTPPVTKSYTNISAFTPFTTNAFKLNQTGDIVTVLYEFEAYTVTQRVDQCYVYEFNFTNITKSGAHSVNCTMSSTAGVASSNSTFYVNFGQPLVAIDFTPPTMIQYSTRNYTVKITASNGDLRNVSVTLDITNQSIVNITAGETWSKNISEILNGNMGSVTWSINGTGLGSTNINSSVNSTTLEGGANSSNVTITVILSDPNPPSVNDFWFEQSGLFTNKTNLGTAYDIVANITDDFGVQSAVAEVTYPNGTVINGTMSVVSTDIWRLRFGIGNNPENLVLDKIENYSVRVFASDVGNNENVSLVSKSFNVSNVYDLSSVYLYSVYNRGETITLQAKDVNGQVVANPTWSVNLTKYNQTTETNTTQSTYYTYQILANDPDGNYTLFANVSKDGNSANNTWQFNVSSRFNVTGTVAPAVPAKGASLSVSFNVYNARGVMVSGSGYATIRCLNSSYLEQTINTVTTNGFGSASGCFAINSYGAQFNITINVSDDSNNTGETTLVLTTESISIPSTPSGGGEGGGKGGAAPPVNITIYNVTEKIVRDFNFTISEPVITIIKGENKTITGTLSNVGTTSLTIHSSLEESDCCVVSLPSTFALEKRAEKDFDINVHVNTTMQPGEYLVRIKMAEIGLEKSKSIKVIVLENQLIVALNQIENVELPALKASLTEYARSGVDVQHLAEKLNEMQATAESAKAAVQRDDIKSLGEYVRTLSGDLDEVRSELERRYIEKFLMDYRWHIIGGIMATILSAYLVTQVAIPFYRLGREVRRLNEEEKELVQSRIETEKQYFLRKIDEKTFYNIMSAKQGEILKVRGAINLKREELRTLFASKLHPMGLVNWFRDGFVYIGKALSNIKYKILANKRKIIWR